MVRFMERVRKSRGATMVEYGLLAALIAVALIVAMTTLQGKLGSTFKAVSDSLR